MDKIPMTAKGAEALRAELVRLKQVERPRIVKAISEAREQGDLRENAEFQYAKEEQGFIEGRIGEIENKLSAAQVINVKDIAATGRVIFGTTVTVVNLANDSQSRYQIVGDDEADLKVNKLSVYSPIARALIGKEIGDVAVVSTPNGDVELEVSEVEHI
ncbi:MAG: transcription elongation factor GreA [Proteobacteria bacterium]|jgi:transcription elongation factor GreA|nr:transcription elongation factor GreA [Pseudomonadota bacterium]MDA1300327.1 transcription elongation factor GreA [Pseudomonadota bacterium]